MSTRPNGSRVVASYPKMGPLSTQVVTLDQPDRKDKPKEDTVPEFLRGWTGWQK